MRIIEDPGDLETRDCNAIPKSLITGLDVDFLDQGPVFVFHIHEVEHKNSGDHEYDE